MSQADIIEVLEDAKKPMSRGEICNILHEPGPKISHHLKRLVKFREVKFVEIDRNKAKKLFGERAPSRRIRLYYLSSFTSTQIKI